MSSYIKGLVETGIKKVIEDEVKSRLREMFPSRNNGTDTWGRAVVDCSTNLLETDPEIQAFIKGAILEHLIKGAILEHLKNGLLETIGKEVKK